MGTPQGSIISPTLSNLVLRTILDAQIIKTPKTVSGKYIKSINLTTYTDNLVITIVPKHRGKDHKWQPEVSQKVIDWLTKQLTIAGLELKSSKTRIITEEPFDFLGYEIQRGKRIRLATKMTKKTRVALKQSLKYGRGQHRIQKETNSIRRGVHNYAAKFSSGKMWKQLRKIDFEITRRNHKLLDEYDIGQVRFAEVPKTTKYISVAKGSTWLENKEYWEKRNLTGLTQRKKFLYKVQNGVCPHCKRRFTLDRIEDLETHHIVAKGKGGKDKNKNVNLYHQQCHKEIDTPIRKRN